MNETPTKAVSFTAQSPRHATREQPESPGLDATFRHEGGWQALSITQSPQTMVLELVNRTPHPVTAGPAQLHLDFRPGILEGLDGLVLAPESEAAWLLTVTRDPRGGVQLDLAGVHAIEITPGQATSIRLDGMRAAAAGGSRATRVALDYQGFFHATGVEVKGARLLHLPVLRRRAPVGPPIASIRTGSIAQSGPFLAGFTRGADVLNDGKSLNRLHLRIANISGRPVRLAGGGDTATRLELGFRTGVAGAEWGLLGPEGDHLGIAEAPEGWQLDGHTIRRLVDGDLEPRQSIELVLEIHTAAPAGQAQLVVTLLDLPDHDDGELVLLVNLGPVAVGEDGLQVTGDADVTGELRANDLTIKGHARLGSVAVGEDALQVSGDADVNGELRANDLIIESHARLGSVAVDKDGLQVTGDADVTGELRANDVFIKGHVRRRAEAFVLGGEENRWYPVAFEDLDWDNGEFRFQILRPRTHDEKGRGRGALMARIVCHSDDWGHGAGFWSIEIHQGSPAFGQGASRRFIAGFENHPYGRQHVVWLRGGTSYHWLPEHPGRISAPSDLGSPGDIVLGRERGKPTPYAVRSELDEGFDASHVVRNGTSD